MHLHKRASVLVALPLILDIGFDIFAVFGHNTKKVLLIIDITKRTAAFGALDYCSAKTWPPPTLLWNEVYFPIWGLVHVTCFGHWEMSSKYA